MLPVQLQAEGEWWSLPWSGAHAAWPDTTKNALLLQGYVCGKALRS